MLRWRIRSLAAAATGKLNGAIMCLILSYTYIYIYIMYVYIFVLYCLLYIYRYTAHYIAIYIYICFLSYCIHRYLLGDCLLYIYIYIIIYTYTYIYIYIYRVKAGGSPEADCKLMVWRWKMLISYCVLQCFLPSLERVAAVKVSMSARINSEFVRAEKW